MSSIVINWHITEKCNYSCGYCYAKYGLESKFKKEIHQSITAAYKLIDELSCFFFGKNKTVRLNFAGGEPFLSKNITDLMRYAYQKGMDISFISNGSALTEKIIEEIAPFVVIAGFSIDSSRDFTNKMIGRKSKSGKVVVLSELLRIVKVFKDYGVFIKINTVVSKYNHLENISSAIASINPEKWKILRTLPIINNDGIVTSEEFELFVRRHEEFNSIIISEDNDAMENSYIMIDPIGRFYQNSGIFNGYKYSAPILECGAKKAFDQIKFDQERFDSRYK